MKLARSIAVAWTLSLSLSGCISLSEFFAMFGLGDSRQVVNEPSYRVGDAFTFGSPAITWRVVAIDDDRVTWRSDQGDEQVTGRNPLLPALGWKSERLGSGRRIISDQAGSLFPMQVGARTTFKAAVTTDKPPYGWSFNWECEVLDRQDVVVSTGTLDAFKVGCGRGSLDEIVFFYAPSIGHYVSKTSRSEGETAARVRHLVAYERINAAGALERTEFARVPYLGEPSQARVVDRPETRIAAERVDNIARAAGGSTTSESAGGLLAQARRLLDRRRHVAEGGPPTAPPQAPTEPADGVRGAPGDSDESSEIAATSESPGYRLVEAKLPPFPPRPKLNPFREEGVVVATAAKTAQQSAASVPVRSVNDIPMVETSRPSNPFDVSIVGKAHAAADKTSEIVQRAREKALRTPGMGDEAMLSVQSATGKATMAAAPPQNPVKQASAVRTADSATARASAPSRDGSVAADPVARTPHQQMASRLAEPRAETGAPAGDVAKFYGIHLGTFLDPRRALLGWQHIFRTHEDLLAGLQPRIRRHDLGDKGIRYRLRVVPFVDAATAQSLCEKLADRGKYCRVSLE